MILGEKTRSLLVADADVAAVVVGRVFPAKLPQGVTLPAIRYFVVSDIPQPALPSSTVGARMARVQVDCFAKKYLDAQSLADKVAAALEVKESGFTSMQLSRRDQYEDESETHGVSLDFSMWITEA